jgi:hypothetical protein
MGASHSVESEVITKEDVETPQPELEEDSEEENPYDLKEEPMDWFWPFV